MGNDILSVTIPMGALLGGLTAIVVVFMGALWGLLSFGLSGIRDDVASIRRDVVAILGDVSAGQKAQTDVVQKIGEIQVSLEKDMSVLRGDIAATHKGSVSVTAADYERQIESALRGGWLPPTEEKSGDELGFGEGALPIPPSTPAKHSH